MITYQINSNKPDPRITSHAVKIIRQGGVIVFPTETAYGLAADFLNPKAIKKIFQIKRRPENKKLTLIVPDITMVKKYFYLDKLGKKLAKAYWPGPLTLILSVKKTVKVGWKEAGVRVSSNPIARELSQKLGRPITATSANLSGLPECYTIKKVVNQFFGRKYQPDLILDAGKLPKRKVSTIVKIERGEIKVIREGGTKINF